MVTNDLIATGLTQNQAETYLALIKNGSSTPPELATELGLSRTNAYKMLDKLEELGLVKKEERNKKITFYPDNPFALTNLAANQRNIATAREEAVKKVMHQLLEQYHAKIEKPSIKLVTGKDAVIDAYRAQIELLKPIYFIRSRSDITSLGFDAMHEIRVKPARHNLDRYGITPDMTTGPVSPIADRRSNLSRTWIKQEDYTAPVEWSVSGDSLLIVLFGDEPHAITILNPLIATAFIQIWKLLDSTIKSMPYYQTLPRSNSKTS